MKSQNPIVALTMFIIIDRGALLLRILILLFTHVDYYYYFYYYFYQIIRVLCYVKRWRNAET